MRRELEALRQRVFELQRRAAAHRDGEGTRLAGSVAVSISAREQLLLESERLSHVGSWVWDLDTNSVFWSDELYRILGYESVGDTATTEAFFARVHPDDRARVRSLAAKSAASGLSHQVDFRILRPDGEVRHATMGGAMIFDDGGTLRRMVGSVRDLTEERLVRERLARANDLLEEAQAMANLGSWVLDARTGVREWTPELFRIMGIPADTPVTSELFPSLLHPDDRERMLAQRKSALEEGASGESELRVIRPDGEIRYVRFQTAARIDEQGSTAEVRGTVLDITEQVLLRQRLANAQKMEAIGRLAGGIAHDFNNLLMVMGINMDLWVKELASPPAELRDVQRALSSARALVQRLLAFGRKAELDRRVVDPNDLVDRTLELLRRVMGDRVTLLREPAGDLPAIRVDPLQIEQAIVNLVVNARDAMPLGGTVRVATRSVIASEGPSVEIEVRDNGPGMDAATVRRIFEPFFTTKAEGAGTGLGLSTVLGTVEQHGGSVVVHSEPGHGASFRLRFVAEARSAVAEPVVAHAAVAAHAPPGRTVLIVEDQPMVASVIARVVERAGHRTLLAHKPSDAIPLWDAHPEIALVISDIGMAEMRGPELIRVLRGRSNGRHWRVLFVTGYSHGETLEGLDGEVLTKPFLPTELAAVVTRLLV